MYTTSSYCLESVHCLMQGITVSNFLCGRSNGNKFPQHLFILQCLRFSSTFEEWFWQTSCSWQTVLFFLYCECIGLLSAISKFSGEKFAADHIEEGPL